MGSLMHQQPQQTAGACRITGETCFRLQLLLPSGRVLHLSSAWKGL